MPEDEKIEQTEESEKKPRFQIKLKGPLLFGVIGGTAFVVCIVVFSLIVGVFSSPPASDDRAAPVDQAEQIAEADTTGESETIDIDQLEKEIFGLLDGVEPAGLDENAGLTGTAENDETAEDSIAEINWIETEKAKLAIEREELEALKKDNEERENRLKRLIAQVDQIELTRINALAKLYEGMKPTQVAPLITKLSDEQAVHILLEMKPANASKILGELTPDHAARISANMLNFTKE